jgi:hypothetical protein
MRGETLTQHAFGACWRSIVMGAETLSSLHSIVAGGFPEMSCVTREMPFTSLMMRRAQRLRNSQGSCTQRATVERPFCQGPQLATERR